MGLPDNHLFLDNIPRLLHARLERPDDGGHGLDDADLPRLVALHEHGDPRPIAVILQARHANARVRSLKSAEQRQPRFVTSFIHNTPTRKRVTSFTENLHHLVHRSMHGQVVDATGRHTYDTRSLVEQIVVCF